MAKRLTVVVSQGQTHNPAKRAFEENLVTALILEPGVEVVVIPHLYDLQQDGTGVLALRQIPGPMVLLSWLYERAARWVLDRYGVQGQAGVSLLRDESEDADEDDDELERAQAAASSEDEEDGPGEGDVVKLRVLDSRSAPPRKIYCLDLRLRDKFEPFLDEVRRIRDELQTQVVELTGWLGGAPRPEQMERFLRPTNDTALGLPVVPSATPAAPPETASNQPLRITEETDRRWYPVIDFSRCTNCMECIDFCLFGVYGIDKHETILVEQPDNCRKGCPACSRVCPENAIIFPQHKTPVIAGAAAEAAGALKIDLSKLFGAPEGAEDALAVAARERDEQLMIAGRQAVGLSVGIPQRRANQPAEPKDRLDDLIDALDNLDL